MFVMQDAGWIGGRHLMTIASRRYRTLTKII
jgi:hypothetical protein